jgi:hypothetical protein
VTSYDELMLGDPVHRRGHRPAGDAHRRRRARDRARPALVDTAASEGEALGLARKSRLGEILFGET